PFQEETDLIFNRSVFLDAHPNGLRFQAFAEQQSEAPLLSSTYFSIGGGFVVREQDLDSPILPASKPVPYFFTSARQLLQLAKEYHFSFSELARANERV